MFKQKLKRVREPAQKRRFPETGKGPKKAHRTCLVCSMNRKEA